MAEKNLKFVCPDCSGKKLIQAQSVMKGYEVEELDPDGYVITGDEELDLDTLETDTTFYYCCADCDYIPEDDDGNPISEDADIIEWVKANCSQE